MRRATVVIRQHDPETDHEDKLYREWTHAAQLDRDEYGVTLHWPGLQEVETFVPWSSVVRIDIEPCDCFDCRRRGVAA